MTREDEKEAVLEINLTNLQKDENTQIWDLKFYESSDDEDNDTEDEEEGESEFVFKKMHNEEIKANKQQSEKLSETQSTISTMASEPIRVGQLRDKLGAIDSKFEEVKHEHIPPQEAESSEEDDGEEEEEGDSDEDEEQPKEKQNDAPKKARYDEGIVTQRIGDCIFIQSH